MPRAQVTCRGQGRTCGARLQIELASGAGLSSSESCPKCGDTTAARYILVATRLKFPNRVWVVKSIHQAHHGVATTAVKTPA